ncbi:hypothetical protein [Micromonospora sp. NPDC048947]|uniref:hypothetical protein n=1 Tax=Micromonospora sp. NPDC048947 TaxID=3154826 RepID=UPI0033F0793E
MAGRQAGTSVVSVKSTRSPPAVAWIRYSRRFSPWKRLPGPIRTSVRPLAADHSTAGIAIVLLDIVPSGSSRLTRSCGDSGLPAAPRSLFMNTTTTFAPSSRWASKYHHSYDPARLSVRAPSSHSRTTSRSSPKRAWSSLSAASLE